MAPRGGGGSSIGGRGGGSPSSASSGTISGGRGSSSSGFSLGGGRGGGSSVSSSKGSGSSGSSSKGGRPRGSGSKPKHKHKPKPGSVYPENSVYYTSAGIPSRFNPFSYLKLGSGRKPPSQPKADHPSLDDDVFRGVMQDICQRMSDQGQIQVTPMPAALEHHNITDSTPSIAGEQTSQASSFIDSLFGCVVAFMCLLLMSQVQNYFQPRRGDLHANDTIDFEASDEDLNIYMPEETSEESEGAPNNELLQDFDVIF